MLPLCRFARTIAFEGRARAKFAAARYLSSKSATLKAGRACHNPKHTNSTPTAAHNPSGSPARTIARTSAAADNAIITGYAGNRNRRDVQSWRGRYQRYEASTITTKQHDHHTFHRCERSARTVQGAAISPINGKTVCVLTSHREYSEMFSDAYFGENRLSI